MTPGRKQQHQMLYHDFTDAYTHLYQMSKELYPAARRFVEKTEPEISQFMARAVASAAPASGADISRYISNFDDFTISANKVFGEINNIIKKSETLINRKLDIQKGETTSDPREEASLIDLMAEYTAALEQLRKTQTATDELEKSFRLLTQQWIKLKAKFQQA